MRRLILALAITASPGLAQAGVDPAPVVAAERAFAADGPVLGVRDAFLKHSAPEAIVFQPDIVKVHETFPSQPPDRDRPPLTWWPLWAGIAASGDLGFTSGPYAVAGVGRGYYFTVWRKQPDGGWKWIYDGGPGSDTTGAAPAGSPVAYLQPSTAGAGSATKAKAQVAALEARLNAAAARDLAQAFEALTAPDGRIAGSRIVPENSPQGRARELAARPATMMLKSVGSEASKAGDLVWTHGEAAWTRDGQPRGGRYIRVWQNRVEGWKLVYDALLPSPPKPPA
ncbi:DUF4440 domain-containing protein [Phenylobacterium sp.]|uniref:DUF4440 domain-containing protein n=1 Tax=Phenylobacterium sp. TaxID=1871053 RepID=UPI00286AC458|nr:DUF4440 domain-containing protein [Phenylobacterium sp.]